MANLSDFERSITRLMARRDALKVNSDAARRLMFRIGARITDLAKQNVVRLRVVDSGRLLNAIGFRIEETAETIKVIIGPSNIRYGRMQEYGGTYGPAQMRAMFAAMHARGLDKHQSKHVMVGTRLPPRPYLQPAFEAGTRDIQRELRAFFLGER